MTTRRLVLSLAAGLLAAGLAAPALAQTSKLTNPAALTEQAPATYKVKFDTSKGSFVVQVTRAWAPRGADRFHELLRMRYFDEGRFFRVIPGFIAQFGIHKDFNVHAKWRNFAILDDPPKEKNLRGTAAFAQSGPNTRATEVFINLADNKDLDEGKFVPFGRITEGLDVIDRLYSGYGELGPKGKGPDAGRAEEEATEYMLPRFPNLDYIKRARIIE